MNDNQSYEKIVKKKMAGAILIKRVLLLCFLSLFVVVGIPVAIIHLNGNVAVILLLIAMASGFSFFAWKLTYIEYEYDLVAGTLYLTQIYGKSRRKELFEAELRDATMIAPYRGKYGETANNSNPSNVFLAISSKKSEDIWFIIFEESGGTKTLVAFEADERALSTFRHYCPRATVREKLTSDKTQAEASKN